MDEIGPDECSIWKLSKRLHLICWLMRIVRAWRRLLRLRGHSLCVKKGKFDAKMEVVARFTSIDTMDGRAKRLKVLAVRRDYSDLGPDDDDDLLLDE